MSFESDKTPKESKLQTYMSDCYQKNIDILPPDINRSNTGFTAVDGKIRFGLGSIKGVGNKALNDILDKRPFNSFIDFYDKVDKRLVNKTCVEALIKSGAFDELESNRHKLLFYYHELRNNTFIRGRLWQVYDDMSEKDYINMELDTLNMSITSPSQWDMSKPGNMLRLEGEIVSVNKIQTKHGNDMAFAKLNTHKNIIRLVIFPDQYKENKCILNKGQEVFVGGEKTKDNSLIVKGMGRIEEL